MTDATRPPTEETPVPPLRWPPPGLARIQGDLWIVARKMAMVAAVLVLPLLVTVTLPQSSYGLGPLGEAWWITLLTTILGVAIFTDAVVSLVRFLRRVRRALGEGYTPRVLALVVSGPGQRLSPPGRGTVHPAGGDRAEDPGSAPVPHAVGLSGGGDLVRRRLRCPPPPRRPGAGLAERGRIRDGGTRRRHRFRRAGPPRDRRDVGVPGRRGTPRSGRRTSLATRSTHGAPPRRRGGWSALPPVPPDRRPGRRWPSWGSSSERSSRCCPP